MTALNWRVEDLADPESLFVDLGRKQLAAIDQLMSDLPAKDIPFRDIGQGQFSHPDLDPTMAEVLDRVAAGPGIVILRGLPVARYELADVERIYWGLGAHLGTGTSQSALGDYLGHVRDETKPGENESARGYISRRKLRLHTDLTEIAGLLCVQNAKHGGESFFASALAVWETVALLF